MLKQIIAIAAVLLLATTVFADVPLACTPVVVFKSNVVRDMLDNEQISDSEKIQFAQKWLEEAVEKNNKQNIQALLIALSERPLYAVTIGELLNNPTVQSVIPLLSVQAQDMLEQVRLARARGKIENIKGVQALMKKSDAAIGNLIGLNPDGSLTDKGVVPIAMTDLEKQISQMDVQRIDETDLSNMLSSAEDAFVFLMKASDQTEDSSMETFEILEQQGLSNRYSTILVRTRMLHERFSRSLNQVLNTLVRKLVSVQDLRAAPEVVQNNAVIAMKLTDMLSHTTGSEFAASHPRLNEYLVDSTVMQESAQSADVYKGFSTLVRSAYGLPIEVTSTIAVQPRVKIQYRSNLPPQLLTLSDFEEAYNALKEDERLQQIEVVMIALSQIELIGAEDQAVKDELYQFLGIDKQEMPLLANYMRSVQQRVKELDDINARMRGAASEQAQQLQQRRRELGTMIDRAALARLRNLQISDAAAHEQAVKALPELTRYSYLLAREIERVLNPALVEKIRSVEVRGGAQNVKAATFYTPHEDVQIIAGDHLESFTTPDGREVVVMLDFSGHGPPAGFIKALAMDWLNNKDVIVDGKTMKARDALKEPNGLSAYSQELSFIIAKIFGAGKKFASGIIMSYDRAANKMQVVLRGEQLLRIKADGRIEREIPDEVRESTHGTVSTERTIIDAEGVQRTIRDVSFVTPVVREIDLAPGEVVVAYTDGFSEAERALSTEVEDGLLPIIDDALAATSGVANKAARVQAFKQELIERLQALMKGMAFSEREVGAVIDSYMQGSEFEGLDTSTLYGRLLIEMSQSGGLAADYVAQNVHKMTPQQLHDGLVAFLKNNQFEIGPNDDLTMITSKEVAEQGVVENVALEAAKLISALNPQSTVSVVAAEQSVPIVC